MTELEATSSNWKSTLWIMAVVQGTMMMGFSMMTPFLPLYIQQLGVHDMAHVNIWTGVITSANFLISALISPFWGSVADRKGRKLMVLRSTLAIALFSCLMGFAQSVWHLLLIRVLMGVFSGFSASATALVATTVPEKRLGYALGWTASAGLIGSLIGPLLGGFISDALGGYRQVFFIEGMLAFAASAVTFLLVKEPPRVVEASGTRKPTLLEQFKSVGAMKEVRAMFVVLFLAQFSVMSIGPVLTLYTQELTHGAAYLGTIAGFAFTVTGIADLIASPFLGKRSDQLGYRRVLTICMLGAAAAYIPQALAPNIWVLIGSRFLLGCFVGGIMPTANALIGRLTPADQRGKVYGFTASATFLGSFAGPLVGGTMSAWVGIRAMLGIVCVLYLLNTLWVRAQVVEK
jgi:DHA1 family multidrug resistance protein-like MFS transporter